MLLKEPEEYPRSHFPHAWIVLARGAAARFVGEMGYVSGGRYKRAGEHFFVQKDAICVRNQLRKVAVRMGFNPKDVVTEVIMVPRRIGASENVRAFRATLKRDQQEDRAYEREVAQARAKRGF